MEILFNIIKLTEHRLPPIRDIFPPHMIEHSRSQGTQTWEASASSPNAQYSGHSHYSHLPLHATNISHRPVSRQGSVSTVFSGHSGPVYSAAPSPERDIGSIADSATSDTEDSGSSRKRGRSDKSKNVKEKQHRGLLQLQVQIMEDLIAMYCGDVKGDSQSAGNAASSGLSKSKQDVIGLMLALFASQMDEEFKRGIETDTVDQLRSKWLRIQQNYVSERDALAGTLLHGTGKPCRRGNDKKRCLEHRTDDWGACRRKRVKITFESNKAEFERQVARSKRSRKME